MSRCKIICPGGVEIAGQGNIGFERYTNEAEVVGEVAFVSLQGEDPQLPNVSLRDREPDATRFDEIGLFIVGAGLSMAPIYPE